MPSEERQHTLWEEESQPWDRLPGESPQAYRAFCVFRDLGPTRNLAKVQQQVYPNAVGKTGRLNTWKKQFNWATRADAFDAHKDRQLQEAYEAEVIQAAKRQAAQARSLATSVSALNAELIRRMQEEPHTMRLIPMDVLIKLATRAGTQLARLHQAERAALMGGKGVFIDRNAVGETQASDPPLIIEVTDVGTDESESRGGSDSLEPSAEPDLSE